MSKKYKPISSFNNNIARDTVHLKLVKPMLSNLLHTSHNTEAEIENTMEELRNFISKNSIMGSSQVVIDYEASHLSTLNSSLTLIRSIARRYGKFY